MSEAETGVLPAARQFAVTWGVTARHGGMTNALLRRSRAFSRLAGAPVDVLTFDAADGYDAIREELAADGRLCDGVRLRNLWEEVAAGIPVGSPSGASERALPGFRPLGHDGSPTRIRRAADGTVLQVDRYRNDGTIAISDRRDVRLAGRLGGRSIVLCDAEGTPVHGFSSARAFYRAWLDEVVADEEAVFIVDSKTAAPVISGYANPRVTRIHLLHNSHLVGERRPWDAVKQSRRETLADIAAFEAVVVLSERQRDDFDLMFGLAERIEVVPNSAPLPERPPAGGRDPQRGIVLGSLDGRKRIEHAVEAIARARHLQPAVALDVYGDGPEREALRRRIDELGVGDAVTLHGFRADALDRFAEASFLLLTSTTEGFPLVLAEGMSRGCIPISYDIPYGPADIIDDGVSGFLVSPGDVVGLAERIAHVAALDPAQLTALRAGAVTAASAYTDEAVVRLWSGVVERAQARRPVRSIAIAPVGRGRFSRDRRRVSVDFRLTGADVSPSAVDGAIAIHGETTAVELRVPARAKRTLRHGVWRLTGMLTEEMVALLDGQAATGHAEVRAAGGRARAAVRLG